MVVLAATVLPVRGEEPSALGVVSFYNPHLMYLKYQPLVDYLTEQTGRPWVLRIARSYEDAVGDVCSGRATVAYLGPVTYLRAHELCGAAPLVQLRTRGEATYHSVVLVRQDSPVASLAELKGKRFGFGAPLSTSSHLMPRKMLLDAGLVLGRDVECRYFWHHERAAKAVLMGEVDACGVRDLTGEKFLQRGLRLLAQSPPIPNFPLVVGPAVAPAVREELVRALVELPAQDPALRTRVAGWDEELAGGFAVVTPAAFASIGDLAAQVFGPLWVKVPEQQLQCGPGGP